MNSLDNLLGALSENVTVTLSSQSSYLKTLVLLKISHQICSGGMSVQYLDLDMQFSSMLASLGEGIDRHWRANLEVSSPSDREMKEQMVHLLSREDLGHGGVIVIDSINTLQDLLISREGPVDFAGANQRATIFLSLFQELARRHSKLLVLSNMFRSRPRLDNGQTQWNKELGGGRMIKIKSDVLLSIQDDAGSFNERVVLNVSSISRDLGGMLKEGEKIEFPVDGFL